MLFDQRWTQNQKASTEPVIKRTDLSAKELEIILKVRADMLNGTITDDQFSMKNVWTDGPFEPYLHPNCGTAGCILGWMGHVLHNGDIIAFFNELTKDDEVYLLGHTKYYSLFYPSKNVATSFCYWRDRATVKDAVRAIDNFLAGEEWPWKDWRPTT